MARHAQLCDLISNSLLPFTETRSSVSSKESEKQLLLALSNVYKEIQQLGEFEECIVQNEKSINGECKCLSNIISTMVFFFESESQFIQHLTGKILFSISKNLIENVSIWNEFILLIYFTLETSIKLIARYEISELEISSSEFKYLISLFNSKHANLSLKTTLGLFQFLNKILKFLKNEDELEEIKNEFILISINFFEKLNWDLYARIDSSKLKDIISGNILQYMCSLIGKNDSNNDLFEKSNLNLKLFDIFPNILFCFLDSSNNCLYQYMRHKILMLMIRLSSQIKLQNSPHPIQYLNSLKHYFHDLINKPLQNYEITPENCLQESPFCPNKSQNRHLQRQTLFLLFKYCFYLIKAKEICYLNIGFLEISNWLKLNYNENSDLNFGLYFIQLYIDEDDMLFNMLLLLLETSTLQIYDPGNECNYEDTLEIFSNIFNPVYLFHFLLLLLDYDHMVIIDYLISKDTGVLCAQYILRCLRLISQSWENFVQFSVSRGEFKLRSNNQCTKRQKSGQNQSFENAKGCLISLKNSLENLNNKNLFPYNPKALIKSLARFQELCDQ